MPAFVPNCDHDVFVSYAQVDDETPSAARRGWVSTLVANVMQTVDQQLGRRDAAAWWWDRRDLRGNGQVTPAITAAVERSAALLVVHSPGYAASQWCRQEVTAFLAAHPDPADAAARVFLVERDPVDRQARVGGLSELRGYRFWARERDEPRHRLLGHPEPRPDERAYWQAVTDLGYDLAGQLKKKAAAAQGGKPPERRGTVFLAEVTDDLEAARQDIRRFLNQAGWDVLPSDVEYPRGARAPFADAAGKDVERSAAFVQLLSELPGRRPADDAARSYVAIQSNLADARRRAVGAVGYPVLQWRRRGVDVATVADPDHRALLERPTVLELGIEEFKQEVARALDRPAPPPTPPAQQIGVYVYNKADDAEQARAIAAALERYGAWCAVSFKGGVEEAKAFLSDCDGLIVVYGACEPDWVRNQLWALRKVLSQQEHPPVLALYHGPPPPPPAKAGFGLSVPQMLALTCPNGPTEAELQRFVDRIRDAKERKQP